MDTNVLLLVLHVLLALGIISLVLLQKGKGASEGASFGGGATSVFGASGSSNFLSKSTAILATGFFINSLVLAYLAANRDMPESIIDKIEGKESTELVQPAPETKIDETVPAPAPVDKAAESDVPPPAAE